MALVKMGPGRRWALVHDLAETQDKKLQGTFFSSEQNRAKSSAFIRGVPRDLQEWTFVQRRKDIEDGREFHGTRENMQKYPRSEAVLCVLDTDEDIIVEGFSLADSKLSSSVITTIKNAF